MASENLDKMKALDLAMRQIEKDFGKGSIMKLGEASSKMNIEVIPCENNGKDFIDKILK